MRGELRAFGKQAIENICLYGDISPEDLSTVF
jgi:hypothetical protein